MSTAPVPVVLGPNQPTGRPYRGGAGIAALRGEGSDDPFAPEDFVASTTAVFGSDTVGLTTLPDGRLLRDAVAADPEGWLGAEHIARHGADTALLVKLLSTGERLFDHVHPDADFAARHLGSARGKTEAWVITDTGAAATGTVRLGFRRSVTREELVDWFERQDVDAMLDAMHVLEVRAGDWVHVPAGTPHSIGPDITLVELQEPVDLSILVEYAGFGLDRQTALLGLDRDTALGAVDTAVMSDERLAGLHGATGEGERVRLLPREADRYFAAEQLTVTRPVTFDPAFAVLVVLDGAGTLTWDGGAVELHRGSTVVVPHGAGAVAVQGALRVLRCLPAPD